MTRSSTAKRMMQKLMRWVDLQCKSQTREEIKPLLTHNLHSEDVSVRASDGPGVELEQKLAKEVLRTVVHLADSGQSEAMSSDHLTNMVEQTVSDTFAQLFVQKGNLSFLQSISKMLCELENTREQCSGCGKAQVLDTVLEAFHRCVFIQLDQALRKDPSGSNALLLLYFVTSLYLSNNLMERINVEDKKFRVSDPLILADWLHRAQMKHLDYTQKYISETLRRILKVEEDFHFSEDHWNHMEEEFIRLHLDVEQFLTSQISQAEKVSKVLMGKVQKICYQELLSFIEKYVKNETKHLKCQIKQDPSNHMHQLRTFNTCIALRTFVQKLEGDRTGDENPSILHLRNMQCLAQEVFLKEPVSSTEAALKKYFKKGNEHIDKVMSDIRLHFQSFPLKGQEAYKMLLDVAYQRIASAYLHFMLLSNRKALEKCWGDVAMRVREDADCLHTIFSELNPEKPDMIQRNKQLLKVAEILQHRDINALKVTCCELLSEDSHKHLQALLCWRGGLSRKQVRQVMEVSRGDPPASDSFKTTPGFLWVCFPCCC